MRRYYLYVILEGNVYRYMVYTHIDTYTAYMYVQYYAQRIIVFLRIRLFEYCIFHILPCLVCTVCVMCITVHYVT